MLKQFKICFLFLCCFSGPAWAKAEKISSHKEESDEHSSHYGCNLNVMFGPSTYVYGLRETEIVYEFSGAYFVMPKFEIGLEYGRAGETHILGLDLNYYLKKELFVGFQAGVKTDEYYYVYFGPQAGYDYKIYKDFTIGPEAQVFTSFQDRSTIFEFLASVKYHF